MQPSSPWLVAPLLLLACSSPRQEDTARFQGTLFVRHHDALDNTSRFDTEFQLESGERLKFEFEGDRPKGTLQRDVLERVGSYSVVVDGTRVADTLIATEITSQAVGKVSQPLLDVFGERKAIVMLIGFPGAPNTYDPEAMREGVFGTGRSTDQLYREASRDQMWLGGIQNPAGDVWGPYEAPTDGCSSMSYSEVSDMALDAASQEGIDVNAYQHRIYAFPPVDSCPGGGIGGGNQVWVFGITPQYIWDWMGHEGAHGFGFGHASSYDDCTIEGDPVTMGGACTHNEYGDPTDIMGGRNFQFSTWYMERAGWLAPENVAVVESSQRVSIVPLENPSNQVQSVRVPRGGGEFFHFEYRQPVGFDEGLEDELTDGALVRIVRDPNERDNPHLLDMRPETSHNRDAALAVGRSFQDGNMLATVVSATPQELILDISIDGVPPDTSTEGTSAVSTTTSGTTGGGTTGGATTAGTSAGDTTTGGAVTGDSASGSSTTGLATTGTTPVTSGGATVSGTTGAAAVTGGVGGSASAGPTTGSAAPSTTGVNPTLTSSTSGAQAPVGASDASGCSCRVGSEPQPTGFAAALLGFVALFSRRRRCLSSHS